MTGNKKRRRKPTRSRPVKPQAPPLSSEEQVAATHRVTELLKALSRPPEGFLPLLDRLEVPYRIVRGSITLEPDTFATRPDAPETWLLISMQDLIEGEGRNQAQGSVLSRMSVKTPSSAPATKDVVLLGRNGEDAAEEAT